MDISGLLASVRDVARQAGEIELRYFREGADIRRKNDGSPVTIADEEAEELIVKNLGVMTPDIPVVGEESVAAGKIPDISGGTFWLVDPLDGTREFINGSGEFTVNIALIVDGRPVLGVVYAPVPDELYAATVPGFAVVSFGRGADQTISVRPPPAEGLTVISSRSHGNAVALKNFLQGRNIKHSLTRGSSLKLCAVASGQADLYPRMGPTCEWDIAAGHAILLAAGGRVADLSGNELSYGKAAEKFLNPEFVALSA